MPKNYDGPLDHRELRPLKLNSRVVHEIGHYSLEPVIAALGACGNPHAPGFSSYRDDILLPIVNEEGLASHCVYNPEGQEWTPEDAELESYYMARAAVVVVPVTNSTAGAASIMEAGLAAWAGPKRGQTVILHIANDENSPPETRTARQLTLDMLATIQKSYPLFKIASSVEELSRLAVQTLREHFTLAPSHSRATQNVLYTTQSRNDLNPGVYLSGTSGLTRPQWIDKVREVLAKRIPADNIKDSHVSNWDAAAASKELEHKENIAVQLVAITDETPSLGVLGSIGPHMALAGLQGQSFGLYIGPYDRTVKSMGSRCRTLLLAHLDRILHDFPDAPVYSANSLEDLAYYGIGKHLEQQQRLKFQTATATG